MKNKEGAFVKVPSIHRNDFRDREVSQLSFWSCRARTPLTVANARRRVDQGVCISPTRPSLYPQDPCLGWYQRSFALRGRAEKVLSGASASWSIPFGMSQLDSAGYSR